MCISPPTPVPRAYIYVYCTLPSYRDRVFALPAFNATKYPDAEMLYGWGKARADREQVVGVAGGFHVK